MRKRMNRTWAEIPKAEVERLADGLTAKTYAADWMTDDSGFAFAEAILGQRLELSFPNDATLTLSFRKRKQSWCGTTLMARRAAVLPGVVRARLPRKSCSFTSTGTDCGRRPAWTWCWI